MVDGIVLRATDNTAMPFSINSGVYSGNIKKDTRSFTATGILLFNGIIDVNSQQLFAVISLYPVCGSGQ